MPPPVIGVAWLRADYRAALERAGATIRELDPGRDALPAAVDGCDGVLLTGGADVDPAEYGEATRHPSVEIDAARDAYELALARAAMARDLPLLAICRGAQVVNVAAGGTLVQDIPSEHPTTIQHTIESPRDSLAHDVIVTPGTRLAALLGGPQSGTDRVRVNSRHHQSVRDVAAGFVVSAVAPDGIVEAIERPSARFCLAVQWHPENFWKTGEFAALFEDFVREAGLRPEARPTA